MTQTEKELRERKTSVLVDLVKEKAGEVTRSKESLDSFLTFFSRIANRWSAPNAVAIYGQRPEIKNPVTIEQAKELGHTIKPGTKAISVLEPLAIDEKMAKKNAYLGFRKMGGRARCDGGGPATVVL
jgi:exoribonuclease II